MKKISLILLTGLFLAGCASEPTKDPDALPNGIMQPVEGTGAIAGGSWMPEIQQQRMPTNMQ